MKQNDPLKVNDFFEIEKILTLKKDSKTKKIEEFLTEKEEEEVIEKLKMAFKKKKHK